MNEARSANQLQLVWFPPDRALFGGRLLSGYEASATHLFVPANDWFCCGPGGLRVCIGGRRKARNRPGIGPAGPSCGIERATRAKPVSAASPPRIRRRPAIRRRRICRRRLPDRDGRRRAHEPGKLVRRADPASQREVLPCRRAARAPCCRSRSAGSASSRSAAVHRVEFVFNVAASLPDYMEVELDARKGPLGTGNYRIALEAVGIETGRSCICGIPTPWGSGLASRCGCICDAARDKVGFTAGPTTPQPGVHWRLPRRHRTQQHALLPRDRRLPRHPRSARPGARRSKPRALVRCLRTLPSAAARNRPRHLSRDEAPRIRAPTAVQ